MLRKCVVVASPCAAHQGSIGGAFAEGLRKHGWDVKISSVAQQCDMLVLWGVRNQSAIAAQKKTRGIVCILERGYIGNRFEWTSVSFGGGLNGEGKFYGPFDDGSRWAKNFSYMMQPWRVEREGCALILGQVPSDMALKGLNPNAIWLKMAHEAQSFGIDTLFRPHPLSPFVKIKNVKSLCAKSPLIEHIQHGVRCCMMINSNAGVEAVLAGIPCISISPRSMIYAISGRSADDLVTPERDEWARALAWKQWRPAEMADGSCWAAVGEGALNAACQIH